MKKLIFLLAIVAFGCGESPAVKEVVVIRDTKCELTSEELQTACDEVSKRWRARYGEELVFVSWSSADYPELSGYLAWDYHILHVTEPTLIFLPAYTAVTYGGLGQWPMALVWTFTNDGWIADAIEWELVNLFYPEENDWAYKHADTPR